MKNCKNNSHSFCIIFLLLVFPAIGKTDEVGSIYAKRSQLYLELSPFQEATQVEFELINSTSTRRKIKSIKLDCGCMSVISYPDFIYPNKPTILKISIKLAGEQGLQQKQAIVEMADGTLLPITVTIEMPEIISMGESKILTGAGYFTFSLNEKFAKNVVPIIEMPNDYKFEIISEEFQFKVTYKKFGTVTSADEKAFIKVMLTKDVLKILEVNLNVVSR